MMETDNERERKTDAISNLDKRACLMQRIKGRHPFATDNYWLQQVQLTTLKWTALS